MIDFDCKYKFSARRSIGIRISDSNEVIISAPYGCAKSDINKFVEAKRNWIERHLAENAAKSARFADIYNYSKILVAGKSVPFFVGGKSSFSDNGISVHSLKGLKKLFVDNVGAAFIELLDEVCEKTGLKYNSVGFRDYKSRWGCCDRFGNILFNYKLLMLPQKFWVYVAAHELCHTVYMDHSQRFYSLMSSCIPEYRILREEIKVYSRVTTLY